MIQSSYSVRIIEPSEGFYLTQNAEIPVTERILSKKVYLAVNDDPQNWKEITEEEAEKVRTEQENETKQ